MNSMAFDFVTRQRAKWAHLNLFIPEQLAVIAPERFDAQIGSVTIADVIREQVPHLTCTAHDLAPFAPDLGHVNADGSVKPPFVWNDEDRGARMAALDGLFMPVRPERKRRGLHPRRLPDRARARHCRLRLVPNEGRGSGATDAHFQRHSCPVGLRGTETTRKRSA
jgi:hypothetical protein